MDLKEKRLEKELTQLQLAQACGCDRTTIGKIEAGSRPSVDLAKTIADVLGFNWTLFYEDTENKEL